LLFCKLQQAQRVLCFQPRRVVLLRNKQAEKKRSTPP
jgi:hypothetical protein